MTAKRGGSGRGRKPGGSGNHSDSGIGYGHPPEHGRFKPGSSGNPKGRPKKSRNAKTIIRRVLDAPIAVREGDRTRKVSKLEGIVMRQVESALKGDSKAALAALRIMAQVGLLDSKEMIDEGPQLSPAEQTIIEELFEKGSRKRQRR